MSAHHLHPPTNTKVDGPFGTQKSYRRPVVIHINRPAIARPRNRPIRQEDAVLGYVRRLDARLAGHVAREEPLHLAHDLHVDALPERVHQVGRVHSPQHQRDTVHALVAVEAGRVADQAEQRVLARRVGHPARDAVYAGVGGDADDGAPRAGGQHDVHGGFGAQELSKMIST